MRLSSSSFSIPFASSAGMKDNIKLEFNYSLRSHILPVEQRLIETLDILDSSKVNSLAAIEIFASKITVLLTRTTPRDLYDINNMV